MPTHLYKFAYRFVAEIRADNKTEAIKKARAIMLKRQKSGYASKNSWWEANVRRIKR